MHLGMIGLGRMGANLSRRAMRAGAKIYAFDANQDSVNQLASEGAVPAKSIAQLIQEMPAPRNIWVMVPAGEITEKVLGELLLSLEPNDIIIDGGNSNYKSGISFGKEANEKGIHFIDVGTSGGVWGLERGFCLMIGGANESVNRLEWLWDALAPGRQAVERTDGRSGELTPAERGWLHCGPTGAGHFVKMVHNGIEYGIMASYAEGLAILESADIGKASTTNSAEVAPLSNPEHYQFDFDLGEVAEVWRRGSVIGSWLLDLTALALHKSPNLSEFHGRVSDSGEGRWTAIAAIEEGVFAPVLMSALQERFATQGSIEFSGKVLSAMRREFGGHQELK